MLQLHMRTIIELRNYLRAEYEEQVKDCAYCRELVLIVRSDDGSYPHLISRERHACNASRECTLTAMPEPRKLPTARNAQPVLKSCKTKSLFRSIFTDDMLPNEKDCVIQSDGHQGVL